MKQIDWKRTPANPFGLAGVVFLGLASFMKLKLGHRGIWEPLPYLI